MARGLLLDASAFIAAEAGRPLRRRPEGEARVSVVTLAELRLGVLRSEGRVREVREATPALRDPRRGASRRALQARRPQQAAFRLALREFTDGNGHFDRQRWEDAFTSGDPGRIVHVAAATGLRTLGP